jgi:hypothetical protein
MPSRQRCGHGVSSRSSRLHEQPQHFSILLGADAIRYRFSSFDVKQFLANIFSGNRCPIVKAFDQLLIELQKGYSPPGIQLLAGGKLCR